MAKKKLKFKSNLKKFYQDDEYELIDLVDDIGLPIKICIDLLYDYKEMILGEFVNERIYP